MNKLSNFFKRSVFDNSQKIYKTFKKKTLIFYHQINYFFEQKLNLKL